MTQAQITPIHKLAPPYRLQAIVACSDLGIQKLLVQVLRELGLQPLLSESLEEIRRFLSEEETVVVFSQLTVGDHGFQEVLRAADDPRWKVPVVVCSEIYDENLYVDVMSVGAFDYLALPSAWDEVEWVVHNALHWGPLLRGTRVPRFSHKPAVN